MRILAQAERCGTQDLARSFSAYRMVRAGRDGPARRISVGCERWWPARTARLARRSLGEGGRSVPTHSKTIAVTFPVGTPFRGLRDILFLLGLTFGLLLAATAAPTGPIPASVEAAAQLHSGAAPAWITEHLYDTRPAQETWVQGFPIEYLLLDHQTQGGGRAASFSRVVARLLTIDGVDQLGELSIDFHPSYQTLTWHWLRVIREGRMIEHLDLARIRLLQREPELESRIYAGAVSAVDVVEDLRPGDIVDYAYTIEGENPIMGGKLAVEYTLAVDQPVRQHIVRVVSPADRPLVVRTRAAEIVPLRAETPAPAKPAVGTISTAAGVEYTWEGRELDAIEGEGEAPEWFDPYPAIEFSEFADWAAVVAWAVKLYDLPEELTPELETRLAAWTKQAATPVARAELAVRFVQDEIRYFAIAAGESSHRPNAPGLVFARRFGDCKDKTGLTVALLHRLGIKAWPALVDSRGGPQLPVRAPSPYAFDHVITAFELDGHLHWVDPTLQRQGGRLVESAVPSYDHALLVRAGETGFTRIPRPKFEEPLRTVREHYVFSAAGDDAKLAVETVFRSDEADAERDRLARTSRTKLALRLLDNYVRQFPGAELAAEPEWTDDRAANRITLHESYLVKSIWRSGEGKTRSLEFSAGDLADYVRKPHVLRRRTPLDLAWPVHTRQIIEATLPGGWAVKPEHHHVENEVLAFDAKVASAGSKLTLDYTYRAKSDFVAPAVMRTYLASLDEIDGRLGFSVTLERAGTRKPTAKAK